MYEMSEKGIVRGKKNKLLGTIVVESVIHLQIDIRKYEMIKTAGGRR